jgi:hypothetical protein
VLVATSELPEEADLSVNGQAIGSIAPRESKTYDRLPLGPADLEAVGRKTGAHVTMPAELAEGEPTRWSIRPTPEETEAMRLLPRGGIRVENRASEPVRVTTDGDVREMVWPGAGAEYAGLDLGKHRVRAEGVKTGFTAEADLVVTADATPTFVVTAPKGALRVTNASGIAIRATIEGVTRKAVAAGESVVFGGLAAGTHRMLAVDAVGRAVASKTVRVAGGEVAEATVPVPPGTLAIVSDLGVPAKVVADGRTLGTCEAHGAMEFRGLPVGVARLSALGPEGTVVAKARVTVPADGQATWLIKPGSTGEARGDEGSLLVVNRTRGPLMLRVDGWDRGTVAAGGKRVVAALTAGQHVAAAIEKRSRDTFQAQVDVPPGGQARWEVLPALATLRVRNERAEEVRLLLDGSEIGVLAAAATGEFRVSGGAHSLEARGTSTLTGAVRTLDAPAGTLVEVPVRDPVATLVVTNRHTDPLKVACGDRDLGVVLPGDRVTIRDVAPGVFVLKATSLKRPLTWTRPATLVAGEPFAWDLEP